jgi:VWFA-related protein
MEIESRLTRSYPKDVAGMPGYLSKLVCAFISLICLGTMAAGQQSPAPIAVATAQISAPITAPLPRPLTLDVLVTNAAGKPVADLEPPDFSLLDNNQPRKILSFRRTDGVLGSKFDPPVEVILVLDAVNLPYQGVALLRLELEKFLRQNGGHLAQPTSIFIFSSQGLHVQPAPSKDGNAMATMLDQATGTVRSRGTAGDVFGLAEQFKTSLDTLAGIADNEKGKPGRKMVIWIGPGWPLLIDPHFIQTNESKVSYFHSVIALSKKLREARITVYSLYSIVGVTSSGLWEAYLKPLKEPHKAETGHLALQVLVTQTGGRVIDPSTDVVGQLNDCISDIGEYYTLSFAPPLSSNLNEYHDLKVLMNQADLRVRTNTGYYDQP